MKKFVAFCLASMLLLGLTACASSTASHGRVKCPACGYEFEPTQK